MSLENVDRDASRGRRRACGSGSTRRVPRSAGRVRTSQPQLPPGRLAAAVRAARTGALVRKPILSRKIFDRIAQCRLANVGAVAAWARPVCPVRRVHRAAPGGRSVETPRYVELPHVLRVSYFHVLQSFHVVQSFHDHWPGPDATAGPAAVARPAGRRLCGVPGGASLLRPAITGAVVARAPSGADGKNSQTALSYSVKIFRAEKSFRTNGAAGTPQGRRPTHGRQACHVPHTSTAARSMATGGTEKVTPALRTPTRTGRRKPADENRPPRTGNGPDGAYSQSLAA